MEGEGGRGFSNLGKWGGLRKYLKIRERAGAYQKRGGSDFERVRFTLCSIFFFFFFIKRYLAKMKKQDDSSVFERSGFFSCIKASRKWKLWLLSRN